MNFLEEHHKDVFDILEHDSKYSSCLLAYGRIENLSSCPRWVPCPQVEELDVEVHQWCLSPNFGFLKKQEIVTIFNLFKIKYNVRFYQKNLSWFQIENWQHAYSIHFECQNNHYSSWQIMELEWQRSVSLDVLATCFIGIMCKIIMHSTSRILLICRLESAKIETLLLMSMCLEWSPLLYMLKLAKCWKRLQRQDECLNLGKITKLQ